MKIYVTVSKISIDIPKHLGKVRGEKMGLYAAASWHRLYAKYVPYREGYLESTVEIRPWEIEHTVPYARKMYNGNFNFRKTLHPNASRMWDKAAEPTQKPKLVQELQAFVDRGGLNLGD